MIMGDILIKHIVPLVRDLVGDYLPSTSIRDLASVTQPRLGHELEINHSAIHGGKSMTWRHCETWKAAALVLGVATGTDGRRLSCVADSFIHSLKDESGQQTFISLHSNPLPTRLLVSRSSCSCERPTTRRAFPVIRARIRTV
jgi:hypothetical protein